MRKILLLFVVLLISTVANAQLVFSFGPKAGYQATKLSLDKQTIKSDFKGNMTLGVFGRVVADKLVIQPELLFCKSTGLFEFKSLNGAVENPTMTVSQNNVVFPVFIGYQFVDLDFVKLRLTAAPVFYFSIGKTRLSSDSFMIKSKVAEDISVGAALNFGIDVWRFTLDVSYCFGLTEMMDDDIELPFENIRVSDDARQNVFNVTLGFKFLK